MLYGGNRKGSRNELNSLLSKPKPGNHFLSFHNILTNLLFSRIQSAESIKENKMTTVEERTAFAKLEALKEIRYEE